MSITYQYHSTPIIDPNPGHKGAYAKTEKMAEWKMLYNRRIASQRLNGRLKAHRRLDSVRTQGIMELRLHGMMAVAVCQAQALATGCRASKRKVA